MELWDLFKGFTKAHGTYVPKAPDKKGKMDGVAQTEGGPASIAAWQRHIRGEAPGVGIVPLMDDGKNVVFGCIDIDDNKIDHAALEKACEKYKLPVVITKSKSNGAHVWAFFKEPVPAKDVQLKLTEWAAALGYGGVEIFPKQTSRISTTDIGNWINMPYYGGKRVCIHQGAELKLSAFLKLAEKRSLTHDELMAVDLGPTGEAFADGPPCLQILHDMQIGEGGRNVALFNVGVYFRLMYPDGTEWQEKLLAYNDQEVDPPLEGPEMQKLIGSLSKKEYLYTCTQSPVVNHCNRALCMKRKYGVAAQDGEIDVNFGQLIKYVTEPPQWVMDLDGKRAVVDTDMLLDQGKFKKLCVELLNRIPAVVKPHAWERKINDLLRNCLEVVCPEEASPRGQFFEYLRIYIKTRLSEDRDDLATGNVWVHEEDGVTYVDFNSTKFFEFLKREGFRAFSEPRMYVMLREKNCTRGDVNIKGQVIKIWRVVAPDLQDEPMNTPQFKEPY